MGGRILISVFVISVCILVSLRLDCSKSEDVENARAENNQKWGGFPLLPASSRNVVTLSQGRVRGDTEVDMVL